MSDQERIDLFDAIGRGILKAQRELFVRSAKLGEKVVFADEDGKPIRISGEEALRRLNEAHND